VITHPSTRQFPAVLDGIHCSAISERLIGSAVREDLMKSAGSRSLVALVLIIAAVSCNKQGGSVAHPESDGAGLAMPALFANVPADTPYLIAGPGPAPLELFAKLRDAFGPMLSSMVARARAGKPVHEGADAIGAELAGKWSQAGLESLGFSAQMRFAIYGLGLQPAVLRLELRDEKAVLATIQRIAARSNMSLPPMATLGGRSYWRFEHEAVSLVVALLDNQLVAAVGTRDAVTAKLGLILGADKPARSLADGAVIKEIMAKHGFGPHMVGFANTRGLVAAALESAGVRSTPACGAEIDRLSSRIPRVVWGYTEVSTTKIAGGAVFELAPDLAADLRALKVEVPGYREALAPPSLFAMVLGLDVPKGQALAVAAARSYKRLGDACGIRPLSEKAGEVAQAMAQPLPEPASRVSGVALSVKELVITKGSQMPDKLEGVAAISSLDARALFDKLGEIAPPIKLLGLVSDGKLHPLGAGMLPVSFPVSGGVGPRNIVITAGNTTAPLGQKLLATQGGGPKAPLYSVSYDLGWLIELAARDHPPDDADGREVLEAFRKLMGPVTGSLDATDAGVSIWSEIDLK
jgi:hypothetical protein